jgi:hypothetical protein
MMHEAYAPGVKLAKKTAAAAASAAAAAASGDGDDDGCGGTGGSRCRWGHARGTGSSGRPIGPGRGGVGATGSGVSGAVSGVVRGAVEGGGGSDTLDNVKVLEKFLSLPEQDQHSWCLHEEGCILSVLQQTVRRAEKFAEALRRVGVMKMPHLLSLGGRRDAFVQAAGGEERRGCSLVDDGRLEYAIVAMACGWNCGPVQANLKIKVGSQKYVVDRLSEVPWREDSRIQSRGRKRAARL